MKSLKDKEIILNRNESISKLRLGEKYFLSKDVKKAVLEFQLSLNTFYSKELLQAEFKRIFGDFEQ